MSRLHRVLPLFVVLGTLGFAAPAAAQSAYKWTDEKGVVHFSDQPPPDEAKAEQVNIRTGATRPMPEQEDEGTQPKDDREGVAPAASGCESARRNLDVFEKNARVQMDLDGDGTPEELSADQRELEIERTRGLVALLCRESPQG